MLGEMSKKYPEPFLPRGGTRVGWNHRQDDNADDPNPSQNTSDDPVTDAAISPNGEQLAYVDQKGIHVRTISTGATAAGSAAETPRIRLRRR